MELSSPVTVVKGVGEELAKKLAVLGVETVGELVDYLPRRYEDYSEIVAIRDTHPGPVTVKAVVKQATGRYVRRGMHLTEAVVSDETGSLKVVWFNQPYRAAGLKIGAEYYFSGLFEFSHGHLQLMSPSAELVSDFTVNTARIVPVYRETKGITSKQIRKVVSGCRHLIQTLPETLPKWLVAEQQLLPRSEAVMAMHFPETAEQLAEARRRLGFEEVFELSLASLLNKQELAADESLVIPFNEQLAKEFVGHLPFTLTDAQRKAVWQIYLDMQAEHPMNRLVEGDVGSGKTVVATMAAVMALQSGYQVAFMAPTELLARQHADTIYKLLQPLGLEGELTLLVGALTAAQKKKAQAAIAAGHARFTVGTNALIQEKVDMHKLGLVIIDEQHRFGVEQRKGLMAKAGHMPHLLSLTATPIPRSLALTLYGELDISILNAKPAGRQPIRTEIVSPNSVDPVYDDIRKELDAGRQMFVVCPLIAESDVLDAHSAEKMYEQFRKKEFKKYRLGLLHGKMKADEKNAIMQQFVAHELDVLISTTVIEVGVDVPNASVMMIQSAERFGLAQLHQLRGRVGRGGHKAYCYLMMSDSSAPSRRLRALESSQDGFRLAELDLELRGPGAIYGQMQHGALDLRVAKLTDVALIAAARKAAAEFLKKGENLLKYNQLADRVRRLRTVTNLN
ncbi:MAG TPA: ATP-dependent DNA helicase RecG [Candidatus Saccharimonadales bacterium]|nr:ATP-dependent DNA helicase RecG [Candidatus Saccharimonadales bacterium]